MQTYSDLTTAIANWLARSGDSTISSNAGDFVSFCEARIAYGSGDPLDPDQTAYTRPLRIRAMETAQDILLPGYYGSATVGGTANAITLSYSTNPSAYANGHGYNFTATASNSGATTCNVASLGARSIVKGSSLAALSGGEIVTGASYNLYDDGTHLILMPGRSHAPLPGNYLSFRNVYIDMNPLRSLDQKTSDEMDKDYRWTQTSTPEAYTVENDALRFGPQPDQQYIVRTNYYQKFPALASASTNWLMTNAPNLYLYGSILEACIFLGDDANAQKYLRLYRAACNALQSQDEFDRYGGQDLTIRYDGMTDGRNYY